MPEEVNHELLNEEESPGTVIDVGEEGGQAPAMRDECLAPTADQRWLNREMNQIDRQIERKTLLLRRIREAARTAGAHESSALSADQSSLEEKEGEGEIAQKIVEADEPINI